MIPPIRPLERILLHVDAADENATATRYAVALAEACGAQLHAVYVVDEKLLGDLSRAKIFLDEEVGDLSRDLEEDGRKYLRAAERIARQHNVDLTGRLRRGIPHREVVDEAIHIKASIIVLGDIAIPLSVRDAFGNEFEMILWTAPCPVLVVKGPAVEELLRCYD
jgi:nucleotide-binding universal stress UspA family protein